MIEKLSSRRCLRIDHSIDSDAAHMRRDSGSKRNESSWQRLKRLQVEAAELELEIKTEESEESELLAEVLQLQALLESLSCSYAQQKGSCFLQTNLVNLDAAPTAIELRSLEKRLQAVEKRIGPIESSGIMPIGAVIKKMERQMELIHPKFVEAAVRRLKELADESERTENSFSDAAEGRCQISQDSSTSNPLWNEALSKIDDVYEAIKNNEEFLQSLPLIQRRLKSMGIFENEENFGEFLQRIEQEQRQFNGLLEIQQKEVSNLMERMKENEANVIENVKYLMEKMEKQQKMKTASGAT